MNVILINQIQIVTENVTGSTSYYVLHSPGGGIFELIIFYLDKIIYITHDLMVMLAYMYYVILTN